MNRKALPALALVLAASVMAACAPRYGYHGHRGYGYDRVGHDRYDYDRYDRRDRYDRYDGYGRYNDDYRR